LSKVNCTLTKNYGAFLFYILSVISFVHLPKICKHCYLVNWEADNFGSGEVRAEEASRFGMEVVGGALYQPGSGRKLGRAVPFFCSPLDMRLTPHGRK
jgi:hypothetical protein